MASESQASIQRVLKCGDDYYRILGVGKDADDDAIKKAYRKLALKLHPDKCTERGAEDAFKKVGEAFSVLSDSEKRRTYDLGGPSALRSGGGGHPGGVSPEDIFEHFFNSPGGAAFMHPGGLGVGSRTFTFSTGPMGANFVRFSTGGPSFMGGMHAQQRRAAAREQEAREDDERSSDLPWLRHVQNIASMLGPLLPVVVAGLSSLLLLVLATLMRFLASKSIYLLPIMCCTEGKVKWGLLACVLMLAAFRFI